MKHGWASIGTTGHRVGDLSRRHHKRPPIKPNATHLAPSPSPPSALAGFATGRFLL